MSKFKAKKKAFFRSGLALLGEKKIYEVVTASDTHIGQDNEISAGTKFSWVKVPVPLSGII